jgi:hypothetical protein
LHKNSANRIIALKVGGLDGELQFFPQGFPPLCAKLNAAEIFFVAKGKESCKRGVRNLFCGKF